MVGSGARILLPRIAGVTGRVRTRYPISPVHGEGSSLWREFSALKEMVTKPKSFKFMFDNDDGDDDADVDVEDDDDDI